MRNGRLIDNVGSDSSGGYRYYGKCRETRDPIRCVNVLSMDHGETKAPLLVSMLTLIVAMSFPERALDGIHPRSGPS